MKCPECEKEGKLSKVWVGPESTTLLQVKEFFDENGVYHYHDLNVTTRNFTCSNQHSFIVSGKVAQCPACPRSEK